MTFPILGGNGAVAGYSIDNSLRLSRADSAHLDRTPASAGNRSTFTISTWFKRGEFSAEPNQIIVGAGTSAPYFIISLLHSPENEQIEIQLNAGVATVGLRTNRLFRDVSAWYHLVLAVDTTNATADNRVRLYINGVEETSFATRNNPSLNFDCPYNNTVKHTVGDFTNGSNEFDGYLAEFHSIDGQALSPTDFGEFDEDSGIWKPIQYSGSYGTNGFYLDFENSGSLGADQSGNGNDWTPTNLASTDQTTDTPTNNWVVVNDLDKGQSNASYMMNLSEGNLKISGEAESSSARASGFIMSTGKWYWEACLVSAGIFQAVGIDASNSDLTTEGTGLDANSIGYYSHTGLTRRGGTATTSGATWTTTGDIIGIAYDADNGDLDFYKNNVLQSNNYTGLTNEDWMPSFASRNGSMVINFGQDGSFAGNKTAQGNADGNGYGDFYYAPPSGYLALCTQNLATALSPTIDDGSQYFNTVLYTGNGSTQSITGVGFQPDWTWIKRRSTTGSHALMDSSRGEDKFLESDGTGAEATFASNNFTFTSDGYDLDYTGGYNNINQSGTTYVGWNWKANAGSTSSNTDGTKTTTVQASTTSGFSIVTYNGLTNGQTIGHGLGGTPEMIIFKSRDAVTSWHTWHQGLGDGNNYLLLNSTGAKQNDSYEYISNIGSSTVQLQGSSSFNQDTVGYFFRGIEGYSKFGKFVGNNSTDGSFCYLGFRPQYIVIKNIDSTGGWICHDIARNPFNVSDDTHQLQDSEAEYVNGSNRAIDILSNGFKIRHTDTYAGGGSGVNYIYMAFAENPFVSSTGIPVTAR